jgi:hypothetical protein
MKIMAFQPDFLVMARDTPEVMVVVEVKMHDRPAEAERQLRNYMAHRGSPVGLLFTPTHLRVYRDSYRGEGESSIEQIAELSTPEVLGTEVPGRADSDPAALEDTVRRWLEDVATHWWSSLPKEPKVRGPLVEHLVPALSEGRVLAGGPR